MALKVVFKNDNVEEIFCKVRPGSTLWVNLLEHAEFVEEEPGLLTDKEVAEKLGLKNPKTLSIWRARKNPHMPYVRIGRTVRYRQEDVEAFVLAQRANVKAHG